MPKRKKMTGRNLYRRMVELPPLPNGKRRRQAVYAKTVAALDTAVAKLKTEVSEGTWQEPTKMLVRDFMQKWLKEKQPAIRGSTYESYESVVRLHVSPAIGRVRINKFSPIHASNVLSEMLENDLSASKRKHALSVMRQSAKLAMRWGMLARNPCELIETPNDEKEEMQVFDLSESEKFLKKAKDTPFYAMYLLAITRGIRQGELFALKRSDLNLKKGTLSIQRTATLKDGKLTHGPPKTKSSRRRVALPQIAIKALVDHQAAMMAKGLGGSEWLFCDSKGGMLRRGNVSRRSFEPLLTSAKLPKIRFHDLRHTAATLLLLANEHPKIVSEMLGHSKVSITLDMYSHVLPTMQQSSADKIDAMFQIA